MIHAQHLLKSHVTGTQAYGLCQVNVIMLHIVPAHHISTPTTELCHRQRRPLEGPVYGEVDLGFQWGVCPF